MAANIFWMSRPYCQKCGTQFDKKLPLRYLAGERFNRRTYIDLMLCEDCWEFYTSKGVEYLGNVFGLKNARIYETASQAAHYKLHGDDEEGEGK